MILQLDSFLVIEKYVKKKLYDYQKDPLETINVVAEDHILNKKRIEKDDDRFFFKATG